MTPIEQDKKIIRGIEKALEKSFSYQVLVLNKECRDELMQLIAADRERVALEARLDELERLIPKPVAEMVSIDYEDELKRTYDDIHDRIAELKAQQEGKRR